jgi:ABC-type phosphate transport system substrate-binding protein
MKLTLIITWMYLALVMTPVAAELVVVSSKKLDVAVLTKKQVIDIYMGRYRNLPNGLDVIPLDQALKSTARARFYSKLVGRSVSEISAYWARLLFSGRATPPIEISDYKQMIKLLSQNSSMIGYIDDKYLTKELKVIMHVD